MRHEGNLTLGKFPSLMQKEKKEDVHAHPFLLTLLSDIVMNVMLEQLQPFYDYGKGKRENTWFLMMSLTTKLTRQNYPTSRLLII